MTIPIIGERNNPHIIIEVTPGAAPGTFDIKIDTQHFDGGCPLASQVLLQAVMFMLPQAFSAIADGAVQALLKQQQIQRNGEID